MTALWFAVGFLWAFVIFLFLIVLGIAKSQRQLERMGEELLPVMEELNLELDRLKMDDEIMEHDLKPSGVPPKKLS